MEKSSSSLKSYSNSEKILTIEDVRETLIPSLLDRLSEAKHYLSETHADNNEAGKISTEIEKLRKDLIFIKQVFTGLDTFEKITSDLFKVLLLPEHSLDQLLEPPVTQTRYHESLEKQFKPKLGLLSEVIIKLKLLLPSPLKLLLDRSNPFLLSSIHLGAGNRLNQLLGLHASEVFSNSQAFKEFQNVYNSLGTVTTKLCLLCLAVFPANEILKKRRLVHWWVGEGILYPPVDGEKTVEEIADGIFEELTTKGCIEPIRKKRRSDLHSFKLHPLIRSAVIRMSKEVGFLHFDDKGRPTTEFSRSYGSYRACLVSGRPHLELVTKTDMELEKLQTIFNVNKSYPNFSKVEWSRLKNVKVLYLGRWHSRAKHHIEVVDIDFLKGLMFMKRLRFLSLRGISGIMELPDSLCKLVCMEILDLGACHNLEVLPEKISSLKKLTHLDMHVRVLLAGSIPARSPTLRRGATMATRPEHFKVLEKIDLQCYPHMKAPSWLAPGKLENLKKLYVRGGQLQSLGQVQESEKWTVDMLRLKFLSELKLDWNELQAAFPKLNYVEKFRCPKTTFFPCNENGVWLKTEN
ncbi:hypothetical protein ACLB2K_066067 [Fragaria x ananassa]